MTNHPNEEALRRAAEYLTRRGTDYLNHGAAATAVLLDEPVIRDRRRLRLVAGGVVVATVLVSSALGAAAITGSLPILGFNDRPTPADTTAEITVGAGDDTGAADSGGSGRGTTGAATQPTTTAEVDPAAGGVTALRPDPSGVGSRRVSPAAEGSAGADGGEDIPISLGPVISGVSIPDTVMAGTTLSVSWTVSDPTGLPDAGQLTSWMMVGGEPGWVRWCPFPVEATFVSGSLTEARYVATCDVPPGAPAGQYGVWISAVNAFGAPSETLGVTFTIAGGSSDTAPPRAMLLSWTLAQPTMGGDLLPGSAIVVRWGVTDESGVVSVVPWIVGPNGLPVNQTTGQPWGQLGSSGSLVSGTPTNGVYEATLTISPTAATGSYQLWYSAEDTRGNRTYEPFSGSDGRPVTLQVRVTGVR